MDISERHSRHHAFPQVGIEGQRRLSAARIAVVGCGALGSRIVELLARAGVGRSDDGLLRIIDRDYVDLSNLQRQTLFVEDDARSARPKASAAVKHIGAIDSAVRSEALVRELNASTAMRLLEGMDLVLDGTDNFRARFVINDAALASGIPWIYGAAIGSRGMMATIIPTVTPCLRCLMESAPPIGAVESCDTAGIITPLPSVVAALQVAAAMKWIVSKKFDRGLLSFDLWQGPHGFRVLFEEVQPDPMCDSCGTGQLPALDEDAEEVIALCGRNSVQLMFGSEGDLDSAARRMEGIAPVARHAQSLTATIPEGRITLFADGRIIVEGTTDTLQAKNTVARYFGG
ncbi:MAG: ThiF family adenylyltransferase [Acidobacteriota bacterium]